MKTNYIGMNTYYIGNTYHQGTIASSLFKLIYRASLGVIENYEGDLFHDANFINRNKEYFVYGSQVFWEVGKSSTSIRFSAQGWGPLYQMDWKPNSGYLRSCKFTLNRSRSGWCWVVEDFGSTFIPPSSSTGHVEAKNG